jgi:hypothetical protein
MADVGSVTNVGNFITWQLPPLPPGAGAVLTVSLQAAQTGTLVARSAIRHSANDPRVNNNFALNVTRIGAPSTNEILEIALMTRELVFDSVRQKIYASVPAREPFIGNSVIAIDPITARIEPLVFAGSEPDQLALSDDGHYLYVAVNGTRNCRRVDLTGLQPMSKFPSHSLDAFIPYDMQVQPGSPETIAVTGGFAQSQGASGSGMALVDNSGLRSATARDSSSIAFATNGQAIYGSVPSGGGVGFLRYTATAQGVTELDRTPAIYHDYDLKLRGDLLYSALGRVIDPTIPAVIATFGVNGPIEPDSQLGRIFQVPLSDTTTELRAYGMGSYQLLGTLSLPTARPYARHLIRCGGNRLAFRTDNGGQIFLLQTSLAVVDNDADGMPDDWELAFFNEIDAPGGGPQEDFDGDGVSNLQEYSAGTDPTDPANSLRVVQLSLTASTVEMRFHGVTGRQYQLEKATAVEGPWMSGGSIATGDGHWLTITDSNPGKSSQFYRVRQVP